MTILILAKAAVRTGRTEPRYPDRLISDDILDKSLPNKACASGLSNYIKYVLKDRRPPCKSFMSGVRPVTMFLCSGASVNFQLNARTNQSEGTDRTSDRRFSKLGKNYL